MIKIVGINFDQFSTFLESHNLQGCQARLALNIEDIHRKFEKRKLYLWTFGPNSKKRAILSKTFLSSSRVDTVINIYVRPKFGTKLKVQEYLGSISECIPILDTFECLNAWYERKEKEKIINFWNRLDMASIVALYYLQVIA